MDQNPNKTPGQQTLEQFQQQAQVGMLGAAHMQFVTCVTMQPSPTKMPLEVRRAMYQQLQRTAMLFAPQNPEEESAYLGDEVPRA